ncbi:MAG: metal ABC transporter permease [Microbacteriaceae bacterium]|nr:metal ABC transporter permease [Microbacteriaceae bacterium]
MDWWLAPFELDFQQRALIGGMLAALMASTVGTWLVLRGMSFFGDAFVHGVIPGVAAAVVLDVNPLLGAAVAAGVMVLAIELVQRKTVLGEDTSIGLLFVGMLALGVVIISRLDSYSGSLTSILFGDALGVTWDDIVGQIVVLAIVVAVSTILYRPLIALSLSRDKAELLGMRPGLAHAALLVLIALAVIGSYQSVGTLLVFGLLVGPPATASLLSRTIARMMVIAAVVGVVSVWLGLTISYYWGTAASATMALVPIVLFFIVLTVTNIRDSVRSPVSS